MGNDEEYVTVMTTFQPLDLKSMSAFSAKKNDNGGVSCFKDSVKMTLIRMI